MPSYDRVRSPFRAAFRVGRATPFTVATGGLYGRVTMIEPA